MLIMELNYYSLQTIFELVLNLIIILIVYCFIYFFNMIHLLYYY